MKKLMLGLFLCSAVASAQQWNPNLEKALQQAGEENKNVLLFFSTVNACEMCLELEKKVFASDDFKQFASGRYILAKPDFNPTASFESKADNLLIVEKYNKDGFFPWIVILDKTGKVLGKAGLYNHQSPQEYIKLLQSL